MITRFLVTCVAGAILAGCAGAQFTPYGRIISPAAGAQDRSPVSHYIKHVVIIVQENRSFDNLFRGFPGADAPTYGFSGSHKIPLKPLTLEDSNDIQNNWIDAITAWDNGKMDGFEGEHFFGNKKTYPYA